MLVRYEHCPSCKCGLVADGLHTSRTGCRADSRYSYAPRPSRDFLSVCEYVCSHMVSDCQELSTGMVDGNPCSIGGFLMPASDMKIFLVWG